MAQLVKYSFPCNVRELEHLIQRMVTLVRGSRVGLSDLPAEIREQQGNNGLLGRRLAQVEKEMLVSALKQHHWVQTRAAEALGVSERVLRYKMNKVGIKNRFQQSEK